MITSASWDEFRARSLGVIPTATLFRRSTILAAFAPVYQQLVYGPKPPSARPAIDLPAPLAVYR